MVKWFSEHLQLGFFALLSAATGCSYYARGPEDYRDDTKTLLDSKNPDIKKCYDEALKKDQNLKGTVTVHFTVKSETGKIEDAAAVKEQSTAPEPLQNCVVQAVNGLTLAPPDKRDGLATFVYEFTINPAPPPPAAPAAAPAAPGTPSAPAAKPAG
ncbi:MAG TPA: AgmX/PglI C-terminal domain-containing protein [Polyangiaceae bacterium]|jgi:hypothetical protein